MNQFRLESLSDGIFAIVLTLLTFDLRVPSLGANATETILWNELSRLSPIFLSFILSFALIFTYWRAHHYIVSVYAKNIDVRMTTINAIFFFFIALIPFAARLLGEYSHMKLAIAIYSLNVICISISLLWMRNHVLTSGHIHHIVVKRGERQRGIIRITVPMVCAIAAIWLSFLSTTLSFFLLTFAIVFNLLSRSTHFVNWIVESLRPMEGD